MKKLIFTVIVAVSLSLSASSQIAYPTNQNAIGNFESNFTNVSNVKWVVQETFTKAFFTQGGRNFQAYYDVAGDFIGTTNEVDMEDLPLFVKRAVEKNYSDYKVQDAFELVTQNTSAYFISIENDFNKLVLKVENGAISVYDKSAKKIVGKDLNVVSGL